MLTSVTKPTYPSTDGTTTTYIIEIQAVRGVQRKYLYRFTDISIAVHVSQNTWDALHQVENDLESHIHRGGIHSLSSRTRIQGIVRNKARIYRCKEGLWIRGRDREHTVKPLNRWIFGDGFSGLAFTRTSD